MCSDELWVCAFDKSVFVFNLDLEQTQHIEHPQLRCVTGVVNTPTGVIVSEYYTGLHHLTHHGDYTNPISSGSFSDVCLNSTDQIYALECKKCEIHIFVQNQNGWVKDTQFKLVQHSEGCIDDKLCTTGTHLYVSSWKTNCVFVYTLSGEYIYKTGQRGTEVGKFKVPLLCGVDSGGKLLVCDCHNHRLQVFDTQNRQWSELSGLKGVEWPFCAGVGEKNLWVGTSGNKKHLLKYEVI